MELMDLGKVMRDMILMSIVVHQQLSFTPSIGAVDRMGVCVAKDGKEIGAIECDIGKKCITKDIATESGEIETVLDFIRKTLIESGDAFAGATARKGEDKKLYVLYSAAGIKTTSTNRGMPIYN